MFTVLTTLNFMVMKNRKKPKCPTVGKLLNGRIPSSDGISFIQRCVCGGLMVAIYINKAYHFNHF